MIDDSAQVLGDQRHLQNEWWQVAVDAWFYHNIITTLTCYIKYDQANAKSDGPWWTHFAECSSTPYK